MSNSGFVFHTEELRQQVYETRKRRSDLISRLMSIPHLRIPMKIDLDKLRTEASIVQEWLPVIIEGGPYEGTSLVDSHAKGNKGRALIEYIPDSRFMNDTNSRIRDPKLCKYRVDGRLEYFITDLGEQMPYTKEVLYGFGGYPKRARLMETSPGLFVGYHNHHREVRQGEPYHFGVITIPVESPGRVVYGVRSDYSEFPEEFLEEYKEGEVWLFNAYHQHMVKSHSPHKRKIILLILDMEYEPLLDFLEPIVESYCGPLIRC